MKKVVSLESFSQTQKLVLVQYSKSKLLKRFYFQSGTIGRHPQSPCRLQAQNHLVDIKRQPGKYSLVLVISLQHSTILLGIQLKWEISIIIYKVSSDFPTKRQVNEQNKSSFTAEQKAVGLLILLPHFGQKNVPEPVPKKETPTNRSLCSNTLHIVIVKTLCSSWRKPFVDILDKTFQRRLTII